MRTRTTTLWVALMATLWGCNDPAPGTAATRETSKPTAAEETPLPELSPASVTPPMGSAAPRLSKTPGGDLLLTWLEPSTADENHRVLRLARREAAGWTPPQTIVDGPLFENWADVPLAAQLGDGTMIVTWLQDHDTAEGYGIRWVRSTDGGATWSPPQVLPSEAEGPEYGFVSAAAIAHDTLALYWLDGRAMAGAHEGAMQLRTAIVGPQGPPSERRLVDDRVCDCCQTAAAATLAGPVVAYRNREVSEIRDVHVAGPGLRLGEAVHDDGWEIAGCPVNGPAIAAVGERVVTAWYTEGGDTPRVRVAFGTAGQAFDKPVELDRGTTMGRVALTTLAGGEAVVVSMRRGDAGAATIVARTVSPRGAIGTPYRIAKTSAARGTGFPRVAAIGQTLVFAWTELSGDSTTQVKIAEAPVSSVL